MISFHILDSLKYWLDGPCCLSVAVVGVVSNAAALVVLRRELVQRTFHLLMMFLAAWDLAYLVLSVAWCAIQCFHFSDDISGKCSM